jgi:hypothetical protein
MSSKSLLVRRASAVAVTLLALLIGGSRAVRADDTEHPSVPVQDTVLVPLKDIEALEQRLAYLEGAVAALTEASRHAKPHQLCIADDSGSETCITKAQLDAFMSRAPAIEAAPAAIVGEANSAPPVEAISVVTPPENSQPSPDAALSEATQEGSESEAAGTLTVTSSSAEKTSAPDPGLSYVEGVAAAEDTDAGSKTVRAEISQHGQPAPAGAEISPLAAELNVVPEHENPAGGDLP